jgi:hypothetical protein
MKKILLLSILCCTSAWVARPAVAADAPEATAVSVAPAPAPAPAPPPPPYSIPWQLRPVAATTAVRSDTSTAFYDTNGSSGTTIATMLAGSYQVSPHLAPLVRLGFVSDDAPGTTVGGSSFINPLVGLTYARRLGSFRWAAFGAATVPVGGGSGDHPAAGIADANKVGALARSGMDNAMFAVNYFTAIVGADAAYVNHKLTIQAEATLFQLLRVHGDDAGAATTDAARTNSTMGIHVGYFLFPVLSVGGELRYQRWITTPTQLNPAGMKVDVANLDNVTVAIGPRAHFSVGRGVFLRPGISYSRALDQPLSGHSYNIVQVDLPVVF